MTTTKSETAPAQTSPPMLGPITHVALTVRDIDVSAPWYAALIGSAPVLDEDTGPFRHAVFAVGGTLLGQHEFPEGSRTYRSRRADWAWTTWRSPPRIETSSSPGNAGSPRWWCRTAGSSTPTTARRCRSRIRTGCPWNSPARGDLSLDLAPRFRTSGSAAC
jgi:hypothetical protein